MLNSENHYVLQLKGSGVVEMVFSYVANHLLMSCLIAFGFYYGFSSMCARNRVGSNVRRVILTLR